MIPSGIYGKGTLKITVYSAMLTVTGAATLLSTPQKAKEVEKGERGVNNLSSLLVRNLASATNGKIKALAAAETNALGRAATPQISKARTKETTGVGLQAKAKVVPKATKETPGPRAQMLVDAVLETRIRKRLKGDPSGVLPLVEKPIGHHAFHF